MADLIVQTRPKALKCGNVEQESATGLQLSPKLLSGEFIVFDVLEDVERENERGRLIGHRVDIWKSLQTLAEQHCPLRCIRFYTNDAVTGIAQALRKGSDACPKVDQIPGIRRSVADQTGQVIVVVVGALERLEEIDS